MEFQKSTRVIFLRIRARHLFMCRCFRWRPPCLPHKLLRLQWRMWVVGRLEILLRDGGSLGFWLRKYGCHLQHLIVKMKSAKRTSLWQDSQVSPPNKDRPWVSRLVVDLRIKFSLARFDYSSLYSIPTSSKDLYIAQSLYTQTLRFDSTEKLYFLFFAEREPPVD